MDLLLYLIFGGIVGWLASIVMGNDAQQGILGNIVVGILGAFLGGLIMNAFGQTGATGINLYGFLVALMGSVVLLWIYKAFTGRKV